MWRILTIVAVVAVVFWTDAVANACDPQGSFRFQVQGRGYPYPPIRVLESPVYYSSPYHQPGWSVGGYGQGQPWSPWLTRSPNYSNDPYVPGLQYPQADYGGFGGRALPDANQFRYLPEPPQNFSGYAQPFGYQPQYQVPPSLLGNQVCPNGQCPLRR